MKKLQVVGGLGALRAKFQEEREFLFRRTCLVTGKVFEEELKPGIAFITRSDGSEMKVEGPISSGIKAGSKVPAGKVRSIKRAHVEMTLEVIQHSQNLMARCQVA